ncbi:hypothetical protein [Halegenticoccus soli]|uniref:hypothetical protein n=1 Tax=Halegenticoccus soli TaxID=1985678 RepID=UPI000C6E12E4|nr:hypothetical protein [Halegenticoccus soli]
MRQAFAARVPGHLLTAVGILVSGFTLLTIAVSGETSTLSVSILIWGLLSVAYGMYWVLSQ